jgi:hypothetical protein
VGVTVTYEVPGMTAAQYDRVIETLAAEGEAAPAGRRVHVAAPAPEGWFVLDVFDAPQDFDRFSGVLVPILQGAGVTARPKISVLTTHNLIEA